MLTLLIFLAVLSVLVLSHEWGHFITARRSGIKVHEFGFGFPPRLFGVLPVSREVNGKKVRRWKFVWGNKNVLETEQDPAAPTLYSFNIIPLGGFVKIKGENAADTGAGDPDSFAIKKAWQKALVLTAGVAMNILVATILLSVGFMIGLPQITDTIQDRSVVSNERLQVLQVMPGKPAEAAGLKSGDSILKVGTLERPGVKDLQTYVDDHKNEKISLVIERGAEQMTPEITPVVENGRGIIGIGIAEVGTVRYPWYRAIYEGIRAAGYYLYEIIAAFYRLFAGLLTGQGAGGAVSGPVGVAVMTGQVARLGISYLIQFTALLSLNLAILNILPIPALDGGRLLFVIISAIIRRPVTPRYEQLAHSIGFLLLMLLVVVVTVKDLGAFQGFFTRLVEGIF